MGMDSCRMEQRAAQSISLAKEDAEINPVLPGAGGGTQEPESDRLSNIITEFSKTWGGKFSDRERVGEVISRIPEQVLEDQKYAGYARDQLRVLIGFDEKPLENPSVAVASAFAIDFVELLITPGGYHEGNVARIYLRYRLTRFCQSFGNSGRNAGHLWGHWRGSRSVWCRCFGFGRGTTSYSE